MFIDIIKPILSHHDLSDWVIRPTKFWCFVGPEEIGHRVQGWKLHVAATPLSAPHVLKKSAEVLARNSCPFKFAGTVGRVHDQVSTTVARGAGGKFITAYPHYDEQALEIANELDQATAGLPGPTILSDKPLHPGSLVHYRFGAFHGVHALSDDGQHEIMLQAPNGALELDQRRAWFTVPTWAPKNPFPQAEVVRPSSEPKPILLDGRFLVQNALRHSYKGGVFRALDQKTGAPVVVKQARAHVGSNLSGRDVRDALQHEANMLKLLAPYGVTPHMIRLFAGAGDLFLAQEEVQGSTLRQWVPDRMEYGDGQRWGLKLDLAVRIAKKLVDVMQTVHACGFVIRDFNPNNIMITDGDDLRLIDLEFLARPGEGVVGFTGTPGYAAPEQLAVPAFGSAPGNQCDLFSLGATLFYLASGTDPRLPEDDPVERSHVSRITDWLAHLSVQNTTARGLTHVIVALMQEDPAQRPNLDEVRRLICQASKKRRRDAADTPGKQGGSISRSIIGGLGYLRATMEPQHPRRLWPAEEGGSRCDPLNVRNGAGGVLAVLAQAQLLQPDQLVADTVSRAAHWIAARADQEPRILPGLYSGRSGTALAMLEAGRALEDATLMDQAARLGRRVPLQWPHPGVWHGAAGAGLLQLRLWEVFGDEDFLVRATQAADGLAAAAERQDGNLLWPVARTFASEGAGIVHYGLANGVAGVGLFLLAAGHATSNDSYYDLASEAANTLCRAALADQDVAWWPSTLKSASGRTSAWRASTCDVGPFLLRQWAHTGDPLALDLSLKAAATIRRSRRAGVSFARGLASDGEFLLDLAEIFPEAPYRQWALDLADSIHARHALRKDNVMLPGETNGVSIESGHTGVLSFLLRLQNGGSRFLFPEILSVLRARQEISGVDLSSTLGHYPKVS
ncbi:class IV lanthionine synthetase LanL [Streptomyces sp. NPDC060085]|uniref:class IV lanthionine synthetase LanL n=1 Tax=Streptomyces sp. NPDC060085 TaxID=3347054 RepID=UPI00364EF29F